MRDEDVRRRFDLLRPQWLTFERALKQGLLVTFVVLAVTGLALGLLNRESWIIIILPPAAGIAWAARVVRRAWQVLTPEQRERLLKQRSLIAQRAALEVPRTSAQTDLAAIRKRIAEFTALANRMENLDGAAYGARIAVLDRGSSLLTRNAELHQRLIDAYERAAAMLHIEADSLDVLVSLPEEGDLELGAKLAELNDLKEQLRAHDRMLAADAEVATLLARSPSEQAT